MMTSQRARGLGHRAFYLHPEPSMGSGGAPGSSSETDDQFNTESVPEDTKNASTGTGTKPQGETGAASTTK